MTHKMIVHDAQEMAGCFYESDRSATFRATWPDQMDYVRAKWHHFVVPVRAGYAELLGRPEVDEETKARIYEALVSDTAQASNDGADSPLQIVKDSEAFVGDRKENTRTVEQFGAHGRGLKEKLRSNTALHSIH